MSSQSDIQPTRIASLQQQFDDTVWKGGLGCSRHVQRVHTVFILQPCPPNLEIHMLTVADASGFRVGTRRTCADVGGRNKDTRFARQKGHFTAIAILVICTVAASNSHAAHVHFLSTWQHNIEIFGRVLHFSCTSFTSISWAADAPSSYTLTRGRLRVASCRLQKATDRVHQLQE